MGLLSPARSHSGEFLDQLRLDPCELSESLRDVERLSRRFGGASAILEEFARMVRNRRWERAVSVFDAGAGGADIPRALVQWARREGLRLEVAACDRHPQILEAAAGFCAEFPEIRFLEGDAAELCGGPDSFDFTLCSLVAHHLSEEAVVALVSNLVRAARCGFILSDLERSRSAYAGVWLATRLFSRNRLTRHDGPVSVLRAFTLEELKDLARRAGCSGMRFRRTPWFRVVGVCEKKLPEPEAACGTC